MTRQESLGVIEQVWLSDGRNFLCGRAHASVADILLVSELESLSYLRPDFRYAEMPCIPSHGPHGQATTDVGRLVQLIAASSKFEDAHSGHGKLCRGSQGA